MEQQERLILLLQYLLEELPQNQRPKLPDKEADRSRLFRSLRNIRPPKPISNTFLSLQDAYLQEERKHKTITSVSDLEPITKGIFLWQGDITCIQADAIVNAANRALLGCFIPCHHCIDNAIHSAAGIQLRNVCDQIMKKQGHDEHVGEAKITGGYNLPCTYVIHTVGPYIANVPSMQDRKALASCYKACLKLAQQHNLKSIVFCCISTGEFHFPNELAAEIAIHTIRRFQSEQKYDVKIVFNVFKTEDYVIYRRLLIDS